MEALLFDVIRNRTLIKGTFSPLASLRGGRSPRKQSRMIKEAMVCLCLRQSGLWILDVALPVGSALKDDGRGGEGVLVVKPRKVDCRGGVTASQ
jgi:hypothetical protein